LTQQTEGAKAPSTTTEGRYKMDGMILALWFVGGMLAWFALCGVVHIVETFINRYKSGWYNGKI
jgi:hypothetical protein